MQVLQIAKEVEQNFNKFKIELEEFSKEAVKLAGNDLKKEISNFKKIEADREKINLLQAEINDKRLFTDVNVEGLHHLEKRIDGLKKQLVKDEKELFAGNVLVRSVLGFEKETLRKIESKARLLHQFSTNIQERIHNLLGFMHDDLKENPGVNNAELLKKGLTLAELNNSLFQKMICLGNLEINSSEELENYAEEKQQMMKTAKNFIDLKEDDAMDNWNTLKAYYASDFHRTKLLNH